MKFVRLTTFVILASIICGGVSVSGQKASDDVLSILDPAFVGFDGASLMSHTRILASDKFEGRGRDNNVFGPGDSLWRIKA